MLLAALAGGGLAWPAAGLAQNEGDPAPADPMAPASTPTPTEPAADAAPAAGADPAPEPAPEPPPVPSFPPYVESAEFAISAFEFEYASAVADHPGLPPMADLLEMASVELTRDNDGFLSPRPGIATGRVSVAELNRQLAQQGAPRFSRTAIRAVLGSVVATLNQRGLIGVIVETDRNDLVVSPDEAAPGGENWEDLREDRTGLKITVFIATASRVRSVAAGDRITGDSPRLDNPLHARIRRNSPVQPYDAQAEGQRRDLLRRDLLDDYALRLNRFPGRRVDVALSAEEDVNRVVLDYLVRENNPLLVYAQISNTGTLQTTEWRERFGFVLNQPLGIDDQLSVDYVTGGFESTHVVNGSYELPLTDDGKLRARVYGAYTSFDASEVGRADERFEGESFQVGGELSYNVLQFRELFLDVVGGMRFQNVNVQNQTVGLEGDTDFVLGAAGLRLERLTDEAATNAYIGLEFNLADLADTDESELPRLGRLNTDEEWVTFQYSAEQTVYLEPLFDRERFLRGESTLAHEMAFSLRGQAAFDYRLVPTFQQVAGGLYTVRGYDESLAAGDTVIIGSVEYRLHIPRLLAVQEDPGTLLGEPFRYAPQQPYGRPDWDLVFKAFLDVGRTINSERASFEQDETLVGAGVGLEFVFKRNLNIRVDYGVALEEVRDNDAGDNRVHFVSTLLF